MRQYEERAQEGGGAGGVGAELGERVTRLDVGEAVLDGSATGGQEPVGVLLTVGELARAGGLVGGDDDRGVGVVVQVEEAEVGQGAEASGPQVFEDGVEASGGDVVGVSGAGREVQFRRPCSSVSARKCRP